VAFKSSFQYRPSNVAPVQEQVPGSCGCALACYFQRRVLPIRRQLVRWNLRSLVRRRGCRRLPSIPACCQVTTVQRITSRDRQAAPIPLGFMKVSPQQRVLLSMNASNLVMEKFYPGSHPYVLNSMQAADCPGDAQRKYPNSKSTFFPTDRCTGKCGQIMVNGFTDR
jgi:hypothetical protein